MGGRHEDAHFNLKTREVPSTKRQCTVLRFFDVEVLRRQEIVGSSIHSTISRSMLGQKYVETISGARLNDLHGTRRVLRVAFRHLIREHSRLAPSWRRSNVY